MQITTTNSEIRLKNAVQFLGRKEERVTTNTTVTGCDVNVQNVNETRK